MLAISKVCALITDSLIVTGILGIMVLTLLQYENLSDRRIGNIRTALKLYTICTVIMGLLTIFSLSLA